MASACFRNVSNAERHASRSIALSNSARPREGGTQIFKSLAQGMTLDSRLRGNEREYVWSIDDRHRVAYHDAVARHNATAGNGFHAACPRTIESGAIPGVKVARQRKARG
jgi:hypothetical protein